MNSCSHIGVNWKGESMDKPHSYVVGFAFGSLKRAVILIKKDHPDWQAGKWNGIGGKIKERETPLEAMAREAHEETGIKTDFNWEHYATMRGDDFECFVFAGKTDEPPNDYADSGEEVAWKTLPLSLPRIANLDFLIEAARCRGSFKLIEIFYGPNGSTGQTTD